MGDRRKARILLICKDFDLDTAIKQTMKGSSSLGAQPVLLYDWSHFFFSVYYKLPSVARSKLLESLVLTSEVCGYCSKVSLSIRTLLSIVFWLSSAHVFCKTLVCRRSNKNLHSSNVYLRTLVESVRNVPERRGRIEF